MAKTQPPATTFVTATTYNRRPIFQVPRNAELFLEILQHYRLAGHYKLHAFVVMPDRVQLILNTTDLPAAMKLIKSRFSLRLASKLTVWQRGYTEQPIRTKQELETRRDDLHQSPVRANLATHAELYCYSSAYVLQTP